MRPIPAVAALYHGTHFRSRLEAAWAAFFDSLGIRWTYEQEAFQFADGSRYLPDFYFPAFRAWFEVKGRMTAEDQGKVLNLARECGPLGQVVMLGGAPAGVTFGEVGESGELNLAADWVRCARCRKWSISLVMCRVCNYVDTTLTTFTESIQSGRYARGALVWRGDEIVELPVNVRALGWAQDGLDALTECGLPVVNDHGWRLF